MVRLHIVSCFLVLTLSSGIYLSGCHNTPAPDKFSFKDETSMRKTLEGTWILEEYMDSTDAGLTPKLLEYMLGKWNQICYESGKARIFSLSQTRNAKGSSDTEYRDSCTVHFYPGANKMIFRIAPQVWQHRQPAIDTAEFILSGNDTVLRVHIDSNVIDFIKYDIGRCEQMAEYSHLVNSKFIVGKYFALDDTARRHHIIFTKCGSIEGAQYIAPQYKDCSNYDVVIKGFLTEPDQISIYNQSNHSGIQASIMPWRVQNDSLIIGDIVLVRAR